MKKLLFSFAFLFVCLYTTSTVYAGFSTDDTAAVSEAADLPAVEFEILSGIDIEKCYLSTFDSTLTISGKAESGSLITVILWTKDTDGNFISQTEYNVEVGAVALFSQILELKVGENNFTLYIDKPEHAGIVIDFVVKRKQQVIKTVLENSVAMPGTVLKTPISINSQSINAPDVIGE